MLSARQMNPDIRIISRASQETTYSKLKLAGANNVILPDRIGGDHMASLVVVPDLLEFVDKQYNQNPSNESATIRPRKTRGSAISNRPHLQRAESPKRFGKIDRRQ